MKPRKLTLTSLRKKVWKILVKDVKIYTINMKESGYPSVAATSERDGNILTIHLDFCENDVANSTIHEILHDILDQYFSEFATYTVYEEWISATELKFFEGLTVKTKKKWYNMIRSKIIKMEKL